eukprot:CAMPEP_0174727114 /NCGR_PEP_ID=MMETSP1094-20130205/49093_1 /TAXON_ID=156173 /ORGANISM="Chrysochromulina brevifilum, Strain UTEX LB 985" /LENGTH=62 /DNA_ID=CAMNT_0015928787 /DNA_START=275 /DNA_END=460 /DNA_ORIENTATION=-
MFVWNEGMKDVMLLAGRLRLCSARDEERQRVHHDREPRGERDGHSICVELPQAAPREEEAAT